MPDCFHEFMELYESSGIAPALAKILPAPDTSYDSLKSNEPLFPYLVNYVDAAIFGTGQDLFVANKSLYGRMLQDTQPAERHKNFITHLKTEQELLAAVIPHKILLAKTAIFNEYSIAPASRQDVQNILNGLSQTALKSLDKKIALSQGWIDFQKTKPQFANICIKTYAHFTPLWFPFKYPLQSSTIEFHPSKTPLIFLEPVDCDFEILSSLEGKPAIFAFESRKAFLSMLQFPGALKALKDPTHLIYILDIYPNEQFAIQNTEPFKNQDFQPALFAPRKHVQAALPALTEALKACLVQKNEGLKNDSEAGNWLYQTAKRLLFTIKEERLGLSRAPALMELANQLNWHDVHKGMPPEEKDLGPLPKDLMAIKLSGLSRMLPRRSKHSQKLRLVHVVPQIVDEGHAPSALLENLIVRHDAERFDVFIFSTERLEFHPDDYPYNFFASASSQVRGPKRLELFQSLGVLTEILNSSPSYEFSAQAVAEFLQRLEADIVVFHGPDAINSMAAQLTDTPLRVLFEHGTPPAYPGFDIAVVSSHEAVSIYEELYARLNTEIRALPFQIDVKAKWESAPYPKEKWRLPDNSKLMTTISNHLNDRLGNEMCLAIAEILQRVPDAYYTPLGLVNEQKKEYFNKFFQEYGVRDRVIFLGSVDNPSQYARSMYLYLNEFPFGSGLGILDAMAAGCPIVSMYDENGPQQGRYGGHYFGIDRTITSGKRGDYVELACRLLNDPEMYNEWSEHAVRQYEKQADVPGYVKKFESILEEYYLAKIFPE